MCFLRKPKLVWYECMYDIHPYHTQGINILLFTHKHMPCSAKRTFQLMLTLMEPSGSETGRPASLSSTGPLYPDTGPDHTQSTSCNHKSRWTWPGEGWCVCVWVQELKNQHSNLKLYKNWKSIRLRYWQKEKKKKTNICGMGTIGAICQYEHVNEKLGMEDVVINVTIGWEYICSLLYRSNRCLGLCNTGTLEQFPSSLLKDPQS